MQYLPRLAVLSAFTLIFSACGGGGGGGKTTPPASSVASSSLASQLSSVASSSSTSSSLSSKSSVASSSTTSSQSGLSLKPVDPDANAKTQAIYDYLRSIWGSKTLSGQQDLTWKDSVDMYQRVLDDTGEAPAVMGYDFMEYTYSGNGSGRAQTQEAIAHWNRGGLVTFCWHWRDPLAASNVIGEFYTEKTDFKIPVTNGALDQQSAAFIQMQADIDLIANQLKVLQDAGVTVLWRPLHEASGGWFWWGRTRTDGVSPAQAQILLWRHIYDRLVNHHDLHNLLWVWNGQSATWYPGDAYVDIVSQDIYDGKANYASQITAYNNAKNFPSQQKLVALSETSNIPDPDNIATDGAWWLWFVVWNDGDQPAGLSHKDNYWTGEYYNTNAHKTKVYSHENVITLDKLPAF